MRAVFVAVLVGLATTVPVIGAVSKAEASGSYGHDDYADKAAVCRTTRSQSGRCANYDWGYFDRNGGFNDLSARRFGYRNCTDFVAWRLGITYSSLAFPNGDGNARGWRQGAINSGYKTGSTPVQGAVAWWDAPAGGGYGHVAVVTSANSDGTAGVEEYNKNELGTYGTRPSVRPDAYLYIGVNPPGTSVPNPPPSSSAPADADSVAMGLVLDSSGSMQDNDPKNRRIEAGKSYLTAAWAHDVVGVVDFDSSARIASEAVNPRSQRAQLVRALESIDSSGGTDIGAAVQGGCDVLSRSGAQPKKAAILFTDGDGSYADQNQCFRSNSWRLYTIGLGAGVKQALLTRIAQETGGRYKHLDSVDNLICEFQQIRAEVAGAPASACPPPDTIQAGQTIVKTVSVASRLLQSVFSISWPGSDIDMTLASPAGRRIAVGTSAPDVTSDSGDTYETITVNRPQAGDWRVELYGKQVSPGGEPVSLSIAQVPSSDPDPAPAIQASGDTTFKPSGQTAVTWSVIAPTNVTAAPAPSSAGVNVALGLSAAGPSAVASLPPARAPILPMISASGEVSAAPPAIYLPSAERRAPSTREPAFRSTLICGALLLVFVAGVAAWLSAVLISRAPHVRRST